MKYDGFARPTAYRGVNYRSRLEARWAAFFDEMGWGHTYEPADLPGWSPDFRLLNKSPDPVYVEVKPILRRDDELFDRLARALPFRPLNPEYDAAQGEILVLGLAPGVAGDDGLGEPALGWLREAQENYGQSEWTCAHIFTCGACGRPDFCSGEGWYGGRIHGHYFGDHYLGPPPDIAAAWARATNATKVPL